VVQRSPVREDVSVKSTPVAKTAPKNDDLGKSTIKIDDETRYKINAEEQHGFGRANIKSRYGDQTRVYNKRHNTDLRDPVISTKKTSSEYRNDKECNMI
jgi:hypothetical protein